MSEIKFATLREKTVSGLDEFHAVALEFFQAFSAKSVVALSGNLGVGKTEFVKAIALAHGVKDISSPTFAIHHHYQGPHLKMDHLDLYRLESEDELETTGFWDFFSEPEGRIFIEWPERMDLSHVPFDWDLYQIEIQKPSEATRHLILKKRVGI